MLVYYNISLCVPATPQARHLIEEAKVIKVIVGTIMEVLKGHLCDSNRFQFQGYNSDKFFRIHVIFHDLR